MSRPTNPSNTSPPTARSPNGAWPAAIFLDKIAAETPFAVKAIQVDEGSEFMAEFEDACEKKGLRLFVLPPKSPQMNGAVERCDGAWGYEFYAVYDLRRSIEALNPILDGFQHLYNHRRPHAALRGITPSRHLAQRTAKETHPSHMS
jgi:putative transposase